MFSPDLTPDAPAAASQTAIQSRHAATALQKKGMEAGRRGGKEVDVMWEHGRCK